MTILRLGNGAGFSGDRVDAPIPALRDLIAHGGPAAMFFETLAERSIALAHLERRRDPDSGYEPMLERLLRPILADAHAARIPLLGNWGAANPPAAARAIARLALELGLPGLRVGLVEGDDVTAIVAGGQLPVYEADQGLDMAGWSLVAANA